MSPLYKGGAKKLHLKRTRPVGPVGQHTRLMLTGSEVQSESDGEI